jgi:DNA polymerase-3 subunit delta'
MTSLWDDFRGHADVRTALARAWSRGRLAQAYLFVGPEGVGKQLFARKFAQSLLCRAPRTGELEACGECAGCRPFLAGSHPDFHFVDRDPGKRELTVAKLIGEREQRGKTGLCHDLSLRPLEGGRKVGLVNDADSMNDEAANALLKTLEEPPEGALLVLIAANPDALLPTIRSRCQQVRFGRLSDSDLAALIELQGLVNTPEELRELVSLADGSLAVARQLATPELRQLRQRLLGELSQAAWSGIATARALAEGLDDVSSETAEQRVAATWLIRFAVEFYRNAIREAAAAAGADDAIDRFGALIERCLTAVEQIEQNVSVPLCLEALCADLARTGQRA